MTNTNNLAKENFADLLDESFGNDNNLEGSVVKGTVVGLENEIVLVDVGLKSEGRISLKEFSSSGANKEIKVGDTVEVYIEKIEGKNGDTVLSREKARREEAWITLDVAHKKTRKS